MGFKDLLRDTAVFVRDKAVPFVAEKVVPFVEEELATAQNKRVQMLGDMEKQADRTISSTSKYNSAESSKKREKAIQVKEQIQYQKDKQAELNDVVAQRKKAKEEAKRNG